MRIRPQNLIAILRPARLAAALAAGALAACVWAAAGPALAQGHGWGHGGWRGGGPHGPPGGRWIEAPPARGGYGPRPYGGPPGDYPPPREYAPPQAYAPYPGMPIYPRRLPPPGYGIRRGGLIPPQYRSAIVPDYGRHRLRPPPPGFAWVRMGDRYMLVSRETGQIFDMIGR